MKKLFLSISILFSINAYADQLLYLTKAQADKTVKYLEKNKVQEVMLWCACCDNDTIKKMKLISMTARFTGYESFYEVVFECESKDGKQLNKSLDLAEVFVQVGTKGTCLGKVLKFECSPCTETFDYTYNELPVNTKNPFSMVANAK